MAAHSIGSAPGGAVHYLGDDSPHFDFDNSREPALTIESGDIVVMKCREGADGQFTPDSTNEAVENLDWSRIHSLIGPVAIAGAEPGDTLAVEILEFEHQGWGWTCVVPVFGLLREDFPVNAVHVWKVGDDGRAELKPGVRVPVEPFMGVMGVAPKAPGPRSTLAPTALGGNFDTRHLVTGTTLYLPVEVPGALFSTGGLAMEGPLTVTLRFTVEKRSISHAQYVTTRPTTSKVDGLGYYVTADSGPDMLECCKNSVRSMIDLLEQQHGLERLEAYYLCSAAGDLQISVPLMGDGHANLVNFHMPRSVFFHV
jgi:acetamidase/formamidase